MATAQTTAELLAVGSAGAALSSVGLAPDLLLFSLMGGGAFVLLSASMPRRVSIACMLFSAPIGAVIGHALGVRLSPGDADVMRGLSFAAAVALVPVLKGMINTLEQRSAGLWDRAADKVSDKIGGDK